MLLTTFHRVTVRINLIARGNLEFDKNSRESFQCELKKEKKELHVTVSNKITRLLFIDPISLILVDTFPSESAKRMKEKKKKERKEDATSRECIFCETDRGRCAYGEIEKNRKTCISGEIARIARFLFLLRLT